MGLIKRDLSGPGYVVLNGLRVLNIITLTAAAAAFVIMLVKTIIKSKFFVFDGLSHVFGFSFAIFLIISEVGLFRKYYALNWPMLSLSHGFTFLGFMMIVLGVHILGNMNKESTSKKNLGMSFWQIVLAAGVLSCIFGFFNLVASFLFGKKKEGVTARMVRAYGAVAHQHAQDVKAVSPEPSIQAASSNYSPTIGRGDSVRSYGHRSYAPEMSRASTVNSKHGYNISAPINHDEEQFSKFNGSGEIQKPDLAAHPALNGGRF